MASSFTNNGDGTVTITITFTGPIERVNNTVADAAQHLWTCGYAVDGRTFASLSANEKLALVERYMLRVTKDAARTQYVNAAGASARLAAANEVAMRHLEG